VIERREWTDGQRKTEIYREKEREEEEEER